MTASETASPLTVPARFAQIIAGLCLVVRARLYAPNTLEMLLFLERRLRTLDRRFQRLAAMILAGTVPPEPEYKPRPSREKAPAKAARNPLWTKFPPRFGWLCVVAPNTPGTKFASIYGESLRRLLESSDMRVLLDASPRMARLVRPLCWALGVPTAPLLPALPRPPRPARPAKAAPAAPSPEPRAVAVVGDATAEPPMRPILPSLGPTRRGRERRTKMFAPGVPLRYSGADPFR